MTHHRRTAEREPTSRLASLGARGARLGRVARAGIGLLALIPVLGLVGGLGAAVGMSGESGAWMTLGVGVVWIGLIIRWALRAPRPVQISKAARERYLAFFRHTEFRPFEDTDDESKTERR